MNAYLWILWRECFALLPAWSVSRMHEVNKESHGSIDIDFWSFYVEHTLIYDFAYFCKFLKIFDFHEMSIWVYVWCRGASGIIVVYHRRLWDTWCEALSVNGNLRGAEGWILMISELMLESHRILQNILCSLKLIWYNW